MSTDQPAERERGPGDAPATDVSSENLAFVESLYQDYRRDPQAVTPEWREVFAGWAPSPAAQAGPRFARYSLFNPPGARPQPAAGNGFDYALLQDHVDQLLRAYRVWGHLEARIDPLERPRPMVPELDPAYYGFSPEDLERSFSVSTISGPARMTLRQILERLRNTYCRSTGVQFMHLNDGNVKEWLQRRMESSENRLALSASQQLSILEKLIDAVVFEDFLQKKYLGAKSFSLEGGESLIPLLQLAIDKAAAQRIRGVVIGMAHRGRLNVLANIIGKRPQAIFREFEGTAPEFSERLGDVKYHQGFGKDLVLPDGHRVHLSLTFNPSHLEFVNTVALGRVRANQDRYRDPAHQRGMCILIHGDAAFAGEGIVQETLNLSQLKGYGVGGTIHVVLNNQIGFTTDPTDSRSCQYATDVAKMLQSPLFHVNGEDPEAVAAVIDLALDFRKTFQRDIVIDMYCYRRRGHNEGDEPSYTQPQMYEAIQRRQRVDEVYLERLLDLGSITRERAQELTAQSRARLESELAVVRSEEQAPGVGKLGEIWSNYLGGPEENAPRVDTALAPERASELLLALTQLPAGFTPHPKLERFLDARRRMAAGEQPLDWSAAEALAFASLAAQGVRVRLSGQDSQRGTFSHRHAVFHDYQTGAEYTPLQHVKDGQAPVEVINSPLSEAGVLGFEYGYSLDAPDSLVLWEAQFGDFANAAQVIIDQFIASAEDKWQYLSGLVLLLPHGFEGMGPEHSSARLERFLLLSAADNMQIVVPSTPAQYFHVLRRQVLRGWRKPLIVFTPKSFLRHPAAVSPLKDFAGARFQRIMPDALPAERAVTRVLLASGKVYYELAEERERRGAADVAILRLEQLYPLPDSDLAEALAPFAPGTPVVWIQEEPENMGAWRYLRHYHCPQFLGQWPLKGVYRPTAPSPATGSEHVHKREQAALIARAFEEKL